MKNEKRSRKRLLAVRRALKNDQNSLGIQIVSIGDMDQLMVFRVLGEADHYAPEITIERYDGDDLSLRMKFVLEQHFASRGDAVRWIVSEQDRVAEMYKGRNKS